MPLLFYLIAVTSTATEKSLNINRGFNNSCYKSTLFPGSQFFLLSPSSSIPPQPSLSLAPGDEKERDPGNEVVTRLS